MFPEVKLRRQILDYQLPGKSNLISHYGFFTIENLPRNSNIQPSNRIQTVDIETDFSLVFSTEISKNIQHKNSQLTNSIFRNDVFPIIYSYISFLDPNKTFYYLHHKHFDTQK